MFAKKQELLNALIQLSGESFIMINTNQEGVSIPESIPRTRPWSLSVRLTKGNTTFGESSLTATFTQGTIVVPYSSIYTIECRPMGETYEFKEAIPKQLKRILSLFEVKEKPENELSFKKESKKLKK